MPVAKPAWVIGKPSLVHVYAIFAGLPSAFKFIIRGSPSIPLTDFSVFSSKTGLSEIEIREYSTHILFTFYVK